MKSQRGFTLIELVVVIIMAAIAMPKFIDLSLEAHNAAAKGVAGCVASSLASEPNGSFQFSPTHQPQTVQRKFHS